MIYCQRTGREIINKIVCWFGQWRETESAYVRPDMPCAAPCIHIHVRASKARQPIAYSSFRSTPSSISPAALSYVAESADIAFEYTMSLRPTQLAAGGV